MGAMAGGDTAVTRTTGDGEAMVIIEASIADGKSKHGTFTAYAEHKP